MLQLLIIGNSSAGRETYEVFMDTVQSDPAPGMAFKGFLSHRTYESRLGPLEHLFLGSDETYAVRPGDRFIVAVADPAIRLAAYTAMKERGAVFCNIISKRAYVSPDAALGDGNIIGMGCTVTGGVCMGNANYLNGGCRIGHDVRMGDGNFLGPGVTLLGHAVAGDRNVFGTNSVLMGKCVVGNNNIIAPGSVVYKGCKSHVRMAGNPAAGV